MYRVVQQQGDMLMVPQIVLSKLTSTKSEDGRFKVALYALMQQDIDVESAAKSLHMKESDVQRAMDFWEGAGLLEKAQLPEQALEGSFKGRRRMTTSDVAAASITNTNLGGMLDELQRIFGGVLSQNDINIFVTLKESDKFPEELILLAAAHCVNENKISARYIEKVLFSWSRDGILSLQQADDYLCLMEKRKKREKQVSKLVGMPETGLALREKKIIALWFEEFKYGKDMIQAAQQLAGENQNKIAYINGILKKWDAKGYKTPKDVWQNEENRNLKVQSSREVAGGKDILQAGETYVPLYKRGEA